MSFKTDATGKDKAHYNHNGGSSQIDYVCATHNFHAI